MFGDRVAQLGRDRAARTAAQHAAVLDAHGNLKRLQPIEQLARRHISSSSKSAAAPAFTP